MLNQRKHELANAYQRLHFSLVEILYYEDPEVMGYRIGAPLDEYSHEASRLIVNLRGATTLEDVDKRLRAMFSSVTNTLVGRVFETWVEFLAKLREGELPREKGVES